MYVEVIEQFRRWKPGKKIEITNELFKEFGVKHFKEITKANFDGIEEFDKKTKKVRRNGNNQRTQPKVETRGRVDRKGN